MDWITDLVTNAVSGGLTGLLGTVFSGLMMWKENADKRAFEIEMRKMDISERKAEAEITLKQIEAESEAARVQGELTAFTASLNSDRASYSVGTDKHLALVIVDVVRGLIRPVLTVALVWVMTVVTFDVIEASGGYEDFISREGSQVGSELIGALIYMTTTAVLWWYGARSVSKSLK